MERCLFGAGIGRVPLPQTSCPHLSNHTSTPPPPHTHTHFLFRVAQTSNNRRFWAFLHCFAHQPFTRYPLHRDTRKNGHTKIPVREDTGNLEILPKHRKNTGNFVDSSCKKVPDFKGKGCYDICRESFKSLENAIFIDMLTVMVSKLMVESHYGQYLLGTGEIVLKIVSIFRLIQLQFSSFREHEPF